MKSYPSTFNYGGVNLVIQGKEGKNHPDYLISNNTSFDVSRIKAANINSDAFMKQQLLNVENIDITRYNKRQAMTNLDSASSGLSGHYTNNSFTDSNGIVRSALYENPLNITASNIRSMNNYRLLYKNRLKSIIDAGKVDGGLQVLIGHTATTPSMFNPVNNVQVLGFCGNMPLLNNVSSNQRQYDSDITDCSIRKLVHASLKNASPGLGNAKYRYADFMYCKDLGKVSNNHLITLRRFPYPVGDNIFETSGLKYVDKTPHNFEQFGSMGTLVSWFGTEDNKLEDILNFSYKATWKQLSSKIEQIDSKEDAENRGIIGMLANTLNPNYNQHVAGGYAGENSLFGFLATTLRKHNIVNINMNAGADNREILRNYDNNKVYEPKNTIQDTHIYEGKLVFNHDIKLTFSYKLRAYDSINPKSAFIDLIGNILEVTYRRGKFWGGSRKMIGPSKNTSVWTKANAFIDQAWEKLGGMMTGLLSGSIDFGNIMSAIAGAISEGASALVNGAQTVAKNLASGNLSNEVLEHWNKLNKSTGFSKGFKAMLQNKLGRPALYAMDSLLTGDDVGVWHVTIGNPFNPIAAIGNLILEDSNITLGGPLGIDDFPTEIKVTVTLKHGRSRDATEIGRMFTRGEGAIYTPTANHKLSDFFSFAGGTVGGKTVEDRLEEYRQTDTKRVAEAASQTKLVNETIYKRNEGVSESEPAEVDEKSFGGLSAEQQKMYTKTTKKVSYPNVTPGQSHLVDEFKTQQIHEAADFEYELPKLYVSTAIQTPNEAMHYHGHMTTLYMRQATDEIA